MTRIDDKAVVPLSWVLSGFAVGFAPVIAIAMWVQAVNFRLARIEDKLGIIQIHADQAAPLEREAFFSGGLNFCDSGLFQNQGRD